MKLSFSDIPMLKGFIYERQKRIEELEKLPSSPENLAEIRKITAEAKDLARSVKALKGNMYPYAS